LENRRSGGAAGGFAETELWAKRRARDIPYLSAAFITSIDSAKFYAPAHQAIGRATFVSYAKWFLR
jgi:hypothetical protein